MLLRIYNIVVSLLLHFDRFLLCVIVIFVPYSEILISNNDTLHQIGLFLFIFAPIRNAILMNKRGAMIKIVTFGASDETIRRRCDGKY